MKSEEVKYLEIDLINHCNLQCPICARQNSLGQSLKKGTSLNNEIILKLIESLPALEVVELVGSYSEPTYYNDFILLVKELKKRNLSLRVGTNGNTKNTEFWEMFGESVNSQDIVRFAIDGSSQELHEKYRVGGNLKEVLRNHKSFKKTSVGISILQYIIFRHNEKDIENIKELFVNEPFDYLELTHSGKPFNDSNVTGESSISPVESLVSRHKELEIKLRRQKIFKIDCVAELSNRLYLSHTGILLPCDDLEENILSRLNKGEEFPTIINNKIDECIDFVNSLIRYRMLCTHCHLACSKESLEIKSDYPVLISTKDLNFKILKEYRGID